MDWTDAPAADFAVLGDPVSHSKSPLMHHALYEAEKWSYWYVALRVPASDLDNSLQHLYQLQYKGVNITVPLKEVAAASSLVAPDAFSRRIGAVNTIDLRDGPPFRATNTDAPGFIETLRRARVDPGSRVLLLGAGGSARALATAMDDAGFRVWIWNRTPERVEVLIKELSLTNSNLYKSGDVFAPSPLVGRGLGEGNLNPSPLRGGAQFDVIVNATSSSLNGERLDLPWDDLMAPGVVAIDLMYSAEPTIFLQDAIARGATPYDGRELLAAQGALSVAYWLGVEPPFEVMRAALG